MCSTDGRLAATRIGDVRNEPQTRIAVAITADGELFHVKADATAPAVAITILRGELYDSTVDGVGVAVAVLRGVSFQAIVLKLWP